VVVTQIFPGQAAQIAGLEIGDIVEKYAGLAITETSDVLEARRIWPEDYPVHEIRVRRNGTAVVIFLPAGPPGCNFGKRFVRPCPTDSIRRSRWTPLIPSPATGPSIPPWPSASGRRYSPSGKPSGDWICFPGQAHFSPSKSPASRLPSCVTVTACCERFTM